jgi:N-succinyldiaminopimelate aminotransferase
VTTDAARSFFPGGESIFATMSRLAQQHGAINLGQGFPDQDGPEWIKDLARDALYGKSNQYAPMPGIWSLRKAISERYASVYGMSIDPEGELTITNGASEALFLALMATVKPGTTVLGFEPAYDTYAPIISLAGGSWRGVALDPLTFRPDFAALEAAITPDTRVFLLNSPHNPTGTVLTQTEVQQLATFCQKHDLLVITDEVYEYLTFDHPHHPLATCNGMENRVITISSIAKTLAFTGWKIGWAAAPKHLTQAMRQLHQLTCFAVNTPLQHAVAHAMPRLDEALADIRAPLAANRQFLLEGLRERQWKVHPPEGTFFLMGSPRRPMVDTDYCLSLVKANPGVALIPLSPFYESTTDPPTHWLRFCFAKSRATLQEGLDRLERARP